MNIDRPTRELLSGHDLFAPSQRLQVNQPSVQIVAPARFYGPGADVTQEQPVARNWRRDGWVAEAAASWPADLVAAGVDVSPPVFPAWHSDVCGQPIPVQGKEDALPCTLDPGHPGRRHQVWSTTGALVAETVPSPQPRRVQKIPVTKEKKAAS